MTTFLHVGFVIWLVWCFALVVVLLVLSLHDRFR